MPHGITGPDRLDDSGWPGEPGLGGWYTHAELSALIEVFEACQSWTTAYDRRHQEAFERDFAAYVGAPHAISVNSGGVGLDLAVACLDADPGDEIISCAINFPGTHLAVLGAGLRLVLAEPDPVTLNLDPYELPYRMSRRTVAVLVTHMNGMPADVSAIAEATCERAAELGIRPPRIIIDAARACGAATPAGRVGAQGWVTVFSFHRKKLMTTLGEGGMLTTASPELAARLRRMRSFGQLKSWGSSYRLTEFQAAVGCVQLRRLDGMNDARIALARARTARLRQGLGDQPVLVLPVEPPGFRHVYYLYTLLLSREMPVGSRDVLARVLADRHDVGTVVANPPTYARHRLVAQATADQTPLPVAEDVAARLICPALHPLMSAHENARITDAMVEATLRLADG